LEVWRSVGLESRCDRIDVEGWRYGRVAAWRYGELNVRYSHVDVEASMYGALEPRCKRIDVEVWRNVGRALRARRQMYCSAALEVWCRCADVEVWSSGALESCCRCADVEVWNSGGVQT